MKSYKELVQDRVDLEKKISEARKNEIAGALAQIRSLMEEFQLSERDVFPSSGSKARAANSTSGTKVAPKYRDPATGQTWTGRGKAPKWIQDQERDQFLITS